MNRLSKPVSFLVIFFVFISTIISFILYEKNIPDQLLELDFDLAIYKAHFTLYIGRISSMIATIEGLIFLVILIASYYFLERKKGYVRYIILMGFLLSGIFSYSLSGALS